MLDENQSVTGRDLDKLPKQGVCCVQNYATKLLKHPGKPTMFDVQRLQ